MLEIKPITESDYQSIIDWNIGKDKDYLMQWAGPKLYNYPITIEQIKEHDKDISSQIYIIFKEEIPIGSIELENIDKQLLSAHVSRFIICDEYKNQGLGIAILRQLINMSFTEIGLNKLTLSVFCYNVYAIRCYEKAGFLVKEYRKNDNPNWNSYLMEINK